MDFLKKYQIPFANYLKQFEWNGNPKSLYEPVEYLMGLGGKQIRPLLVMMAYDMFKDGVEFTLDAAMAVEVFHNFSLMHDDVMDDASLRRGKQTTHEKYDVNTAILSGDVMIIKSYSLLSQYNERADLLKCFNKMAIELCEGQRLDMDFETIDNVAIMDYITMITNKTSVLLACSLQLGGILAEASQSDQLHLYEFGKNIGIAFQIQDDVLDTYGNPKAVGKKQGGDILQNKKTYLYLKALELSTEAQKKELIALYNNSEIEDDFKINEVKKRFNSLVVEEYANQVKEAYYDLAISHLKQVQVNDAKQDALKQLANFMIKRRH